MKFCKKCHKRIVVKITNHCELALEKICVCSGTSFNIDESLSGSVNATNKGSNKEKHIVNSAHKRGYY